MTIVLLAVDETDEAIEAVRQARDLFGADATYLAVNVADRAPAWAPLPLTWGAVYPYPYAAPYPLVEDEIDPSRVVSDEARETARDIAGEAGVSAAPVGDVGDPTTAILEAAEAHNADVIVVGAGEKSWWRRLLEGSVTTGVVGRSSRPVLVAGQHPG